MAGGTHVGNGLLAVTYSGLPDCAEIWYNGTIWVYVTGLMVKTENNWRMGGLKWQYSANYHFYGPFTQR